MIITKCTTYAILQIINFVYFLQVFFFRALKFIIIIINLPVIITPLRTYLYGQENFWMEVICLQHLLIEYFKKDNFLKFVNANFIFANVKLIIKLSHQHFFADMK